MSLFGSLTAGVSGLGAQSQAMSVISDNLANVNTIGYKNNRALFSQLVTSSGLSGTMFNAGGVGTGVQRAQTVQGSLKATQSSTDLALSGNGFFVTVGDTSINNNTPYFYTRAGSFAENNVGLLQHTSGTYLLGWRTDSDGTILNVQNPQPVELQTVGSSARATTNLRLGLNLNSGESIYNYDTAAAAVTPPGGDLGVLMANLADVVNDPSQAHHIVDSRFFDAQGNPRDVSVAFTKRADNAWDYAIITDGENVVNGTPGDNAQLGFGTLYFNGNGSLKYSQMYDNAGNAVADNTLNVAWSGGVPPGDINFNFGGYTGGRVLDIATLEAAGLGLTNGILDVQIDDAKALAHVPPVDPSLPFELTVNGAGQLVMVSDPAGTPINSSPVDVPVPLTEPVTLEFDNGVSVTIAPSFVAPAGPASIGTPFQQNAVEVGVGTQTGTNGVIQFASPFNTLFTNQDGFGSGTLAAINVDEEGYVVGAFTNGETKKLFKLVIAVFQDPAGLDAVSGNLFRETDLSGRPLYKEAGLGNTATVSSGSLEQSTVDISTEFSNMIVTQRAFQASSKIISTVDQMLNELLNLR